MPQDAFTLNYLCKELNDLLASGKVNKIVQPDVDNLVFTIYAHNKTHRLLISANPSMPRIGITQKDATALLTAPNFCMLLRKHLLSATVDRISLVGFDRIVKIDLTPSSEYFDVKQKTLYVELMGRYSNIILTEEGKILGANRGINVFDNGIRPLFVGKTYVFPPVGEKKLPSDFSLIEYFSKEVSDFASHICNGVQGIALSTASEIVNSYNQKTGANPQKKPQDFFNFFNDYLYNSKIKPCVYSICGKVTDVCALPYLLNKGEITYFDTLYSAEDFYYNRLVSDKEYRNKYERINSIIAQAIKRAKKKLSILKSRERDAEDCEKNRIFGELILSNIYKIKRGDRVLDTVNYYDNTSVSIPLDENLSPSQNAEKYYKKYNKQKRTIEALKPQLEAINAELDYLDSVALEAELAESISDIDFVLLELTSLGYCNNKQQKIEPKKKEEIFCREYFCDGYIIRVGRNNTENDKLTFSAKPNDFWVHVKDYHSSHVIIVNPLGKEIPQKVLLVACEICAYYSKARNGGKVEVVYTKRKHIKKPPRSKPGFCHYENFRSTSVIPNKRQEFLKSE